MNRIRVASLVFVALVLVFAPLPAAAQGASLNLTQINARVAALEAALAAETAARQAADTTLQTNINTEFTDRVSAVAAEINARQAADTTLQEQIDKLNGNITATDLEGTYNLYFVATAMDESGGGLTNTITSYTITGTLTLAAGGTGQINAAAAGRQLQEGLPSQNWVDSNVGGPIVGNVTWAYSGGTVIVTTPFATIGVTPAAGGQVMVGGKGGPPGNNQIINVLTRQP
jgi:hypothetical protein